MLKSSMDMRLVLIASVVRTGRVNRLSASLSLPWQEWLSIPPERLFHRYGGTVMRSACQCPKAPDNAPDLPGYHPDMSPAIFGGPGEIHGFLPRGYFRRLDGEIPGETRPTDDFRYGIWSPGTRAETARRVSEFAGWHPIPGVVRKENGGDGGWIASVRDPRVAPASGRRDQGRDSLTQYRSSWCGMKMSLYKEIRDVLW